jgi:mannose-6-phosphate isomerase-like protein (cupin superfamily)
MMKKEVKVVNINEVEPVMPYFCVAKGFSVRRLITKRRAESDRLMLGICEIDPNCKGYEWSFKENDEVYYIIKGRIRLQFNGKYIDAGEGDAVFLPAGWKYRLDNIGPERVMLVYVLTPPIE